MLSRQREAVAMKGRQHRAIGEMQEAERDVAWLSLALAGHV